MNSIIADTCFWISLCDPTDSKNVETVRMMEKLLMEKRFCIIVPHPVLYETLRSDMVKKPKQVLLLTNYFCNVVKVPDSNYIDDAYRLVEQQATMRNGTASMVDIVIRLMAVDVKNNVKAILTRNGRDFSVFCQHFGIPMVDSLAVLNAI